jgi:SAM-dependent methyltransferase
MEASEIEKLAAVEDGHWWYKERRAVLDTLLTRLASPGTALDIGAACGGNTRVLQKHGWQATALDFSATGPQICRQRGVPAIRGDATRLPFASTSLDLVVAYDVLEHIDNDVAVVKEVHRVLKPGGHFLVAVPADPDLWSAHDRAVGHCRRYTPESLDSVISGNHFEIRRMWNWNVLIRPVLKAHRNRIAGSDLDDPPALLNAIMTGIIRLERHLPLSRLPGISLFLEAQSVPALSRVVSGVAQPPVDVLTSASVPVPAGAMSGA